MNHAIYIDWDGGSRTVSIDCDRGPHHGVEELHLSEKATPAFRHTWYVCTPYDQQLEASIGPPRRSNSRTVGVPTILWPKVQKRPQKHFGSSESVPMAAHCCTRSVLVAPRTGGL